VPQGEDAASARPKNPVIDPHRDLAVPSVAVKVLPEHIAKREDLHARFEREARRQVSK
jgi:hypothetical protein